MWRFPSSTVPSIAPAPPVVLREEELCRLLSPRGVYVKTVQRKPRQHRFSLFPDLSPRCVYVKTVQRKPRQHRFSLFPDRCMCSPKQFLCGRCAWAITRGDSCCADLSCWRCEIGDDLQAQLVGPGGADVREICERHECEMKDAVDVYWNALARSGNSLNKRGACCK